MARYTFGDNDLAAERLDHVAATFAGTTRALLERIARYVVARARIADLGCGPGHTTALLHEMFPSGTIVGVDASREFAARARNRVPAATIVLGDALALDALDLDVLPPYDLIYARYLLAHLPDVERAIHTWCAALAPGGVLVLEEPESIASTDPDFARYEQIASALVQATDGVFYAGPSITAVSLPSGIERLVDESIAIDVTGSEAAAMFWRNAAVWRDDAVAAGLATGDEIDALVARMREREGTDTTRGLLDWRQRQKALTRAR